MGRSERKKRTKGGKKKSAVLLCGLAAIAVAFIVYRYLETSSSVTTRPVHPPVSTERDINLYFSDIDAGRLAVEKRRFQFGRGINEDVRAAVEELLSGPDDKSLTRTLSAAAGLRSLFIDTAEEIAYVDFSGTLSEKNPKGSSGELLAVYSVVNTLTDNFPQIKEIKILLEGKEADTLSGHVDLTVPLRFNENILSGR